MFDKPFWRYSSRNITGGHKHPRVQSMREKTLNLWATGQKVAVISDTLGIPESTVKHYLRLARANGDVRAKRRHNHYRHRQLKRQDREEQIATLHEHGLPVPQIAKLCNCTERLVYLRLKEVKGDG